MLCWNKHSNKQIHWWMTSCICYKHSAQQTARVIFLFKPIRKVCRFNIFLVAPNRFPLKLESCSTNVCRSFPATSSPTAHLVTKTKKPQTIFFSPRGHEENLSSQYGTFYNSQNFFMEIGKSRPLRIPTSSWQYAIHTSAALLKWKNWTTSTPTFVDVPHFNCIKQIQNSFVFKASRHRTVTGEHGMKNLFNELLFISNALQESE